MDKETALKVLLSLIENGKLIFKPTKMNCTPEEYNQYVVETVCNLYKQLIGAK